MILPVLCLILSVTSAELLFEGDSCSFKNGNRGVCSFINDCPSVKERLNFGIVPEKVCGYSGFDPIVCCPANVTTPLSVEPEEVVNGSGVIARKKCVEYSSYVFVQKYSPALTLDHPLINVSECVINIRLIIGNDGRTYPKQFPYVAAVGYNLNTSDIGWYCSGALISETFVLTAAHCTHLSQWGEAAWVRVGDLELETVANLHYNSKPETRRIIERIRYPEYKPPSQYHDIALLRLETRVPFNAWIRPACLHTTLATDTQKAITTRWGRSESDDNASRHLRRSILILVDGETCKANWTSDKVDIKLPNGVINDWSICADRDLDREDDCQGDSGAALVIYSKKEYCMYDIVGISSLGNSCDGRIPGIYTRVRHYLPWIESTVWGRG